MYSRLVKIIFDLLVAVIVLLCTLPVTIFISVFLFIANGGKPFFFQKRPGKNGVIFSIIKFKTMNDKKGPDGNLLPDAERLSAVGRFVRKISLDEIPQLINVLKGNMSLVGPRPLLPEYLPLYNSRQKRRHEVKPGITGWAQVNGRNAISWPEKFELDVWYVENQSFILDLKILYRTVKKVFISEGINAEGSVTIEKFKGN